MRVGAVALEAVVVVDETLEGAGPGGSRGRCGGVGRTLSAFGMGCGARFDLFFGFAESCGITELVDKAG